MTSYRQKTNLQKFLDENPGIWGEKGLGYLVGCLQTLTNNSNRSLAKSAGVSEGAIRNLLKCGEDPKAKGPDAHTLSQVAKALDIDSTIFFRLAGYIPPKESGSSARAKYLAKLFDQMSQEKQSAILSVFEAMATENTEKFNIQQMRKDSENPISGLDIDDSEVLRVLANKIINIYDMVEPGDVRYIEDGLEVFGYKWDDISRSMQERITALIQHKLSLQYDSTMVELEWRT